MDETRAQREIDAARERWVASINAGDPEAFVSEITDDAVWLPFGGFAVSTKARILEWLEGPFRQFDYRYSVRNVRLRVAGAWAVERAEFETRATDREGRPAPPHQGSYTMIWRHTGEGWRIERYVDHTAWDDGDTSHAGHGDAETSETPEI